MLNEKGSMSTSKLDDAGWECVNGCEGFSQKPWQESSV